MLNILRNAKNTYFSVINHCTKQPPNEKALIAITAVLATLGSATTGVATITETISPEAGLILASVAALPLGHKLYYVAQDYFAKAKAKAKAKA